ncbi:hypothetical protein GUJ93_ZPchr0013g34390 [Zizania palustris]|uniref:Uncharacterized protein n=1 Tax=Zizania palustris TaxID=103762 RepID=A0A8J6BUI7_ZIZPA|nr:hypothetical protein GUJ93_ZPchr0013g34390 [Zizania palustris]
MGGLRAASPSSGASAGAESNPTPRVAMACVLASKVATVLAIMRRNVRWAGVRYDDDDGADDEHLEHPLIAGFKSLRRRHAQRHRIHGSHGIPPGASRVRQQHRQHLLPRRAIGRH